MEIYSNLEKKMSSMQNHIQILFYLTYTSPKGKIALDLL